MGQDTAQNIIIMTRFVLFRRTDKGIVKPETVQKFPQLSIIMGGETLMRPKGIRSVGQGLAQMLCQKVLIRDISRHFSQAVHVIRNHKQFCGQITQGLKGLADHGGAQDLAKRADMGQA